MRRSFSAVTGRVVVSSDEMWDDDNRMMYVLLAAVIAGGVDLATPDCSLELRADGDGYLLVTREGTLSCSIEWVTDSAAALKCNGGPVRQLTIDNAIITLDGEPLVPSDKVCGDQL